MSGSIASPPILTLIHVLDIVSVFITKFHHELVQW